jgi:hypothetical protein
MKHLLLLLALAFIACDEQPVEWERTLAIKATHPNTTWSVVIVGDVTQDETVVPIPDYATEVIIVREGIGAVVAHMSPDNRDYVAGSDQDTLRFRVR